MAIRIYLASPYSHENPTIREKRFRQTVIAAGYLMKQGFIVYSPILQCKLIAEFCDLPHEWGDFWETQNYSHLRSCDELHVLMLDGWYASVGVSAERVYAERILIPIRYWIWKGIGKAENTILPPLALAGEETYSSGISERSLWQ